MIIKNAKVYQENNQFKIDDIYIKDGIIVEKLEKDDFIYDANGLYAIPGLTDIHFHGCMGYDFCDGTEEAIENIANYQAKIGVTTICPATMTLEEQKLIKIARVAANHKNKTGAILCGINMEGPFLSHSKKGAQNEKYLRVPDVDMFRRLQEESGKLIKLVAIAPEVEGAMEFITELKEEVVLSIAHTDADYDTVLTALQTGASHVTHLYNAMSSFTHRAPGVLGAALDMPKCNVELICDGIHVHPSVIRASFKMFGEDRIILISDSMMATGMKNGNYSLGGQSVRVDGRMVTLLDGTIAGSVTNLMDCMRFAVKKAGISLESAVKCATVNPAKAIGIYDDYGSITTGKVANIVLLDSDLNLIETILKGNKINL